MILGIRWSSYGAIANTYTHQIKAGLTIFRRWKGNKIGLSADEKQSNCMTIGQLDSINYEEENGPKKAHLISNNVSWLIYLELYIFRLIFIN